MAVVYERPGMFDRLSQGVGGMFEGVRGWSQPRSNRLMLTGMGMLSGRTGPEGWEGAMKGLVAGSALDTENKRERALGALLNDPNSTLGDLPAADRAFIAGNPDVAGGLMAARLKPADMPGSWDEYSLTTDNPTSAGYDAFLRRPGRSGVNITLGEYKIPTNYRAVEPGNPDAGVERIPGVLTEQQINDRVKATKATSTIDSELTRYEELVDKYGVELTPGVGRDQLVTVRQGIMLQLKELFNLGVLNGPDLALMENMLWNPVDPVGGAYSAMTGDAKLRAKSSAAELRRMMESISGSAVSGEADIGGNLTRNDDGTLTWSP